MDFYSRKVIQSYNLIRLWGILIAVLLVLCPFFSYADEDKETITTEDIEKERPATLMELLKKRVGLGDSQGAITLRGIPKVAVYLDGVPIGGAVVWIERIKPEDVERIEIYRGAASARFGADALGGAIVIITKKGKREMHLDIIQGYNSFDSRYSRVIGSGGFKDYNLRLSLEDSRTNKTFNIDKGNNPFPYLQPVDESYSTKREGELKAGYKGGWLDVGVILNYTEDSWHYGRPNYNRSDTAFNSKLLLSSTIGRGESEIKLSSTIGYGKRDIEVIKDRGGIDEAGLSPYNRLLSPTNALNIEINGGSKGFNLGLVYGVEDHPYILRDYFTDELVFELKGKTERTALFATYNYNFLKNLSTEISGRYDRYRYFDVSIYSSGSRSFEPQTVKDSFNPKVAIKWEAKKNLTFRASAGTGFIPPSISSLYYKEERYDKMGCLIFLWLPSPDLKPERSITADLGMEARLSEGLKGGVTFYYTKWLDKMESLETPGTPTTKQLQNIGESHSKGVEVRVDKRFEWGFNSSFNYTYTMTEITKGANSFTIGNELPNIPRHRFNLILSYEGIKDLTARTSIRYESSQFTDSRNIDTDEKGYKWKKDGYYVVDLSAVKKLKVRDVPVDIIFAVDNLFDEHYQKGFFQRDPGRVIRGEVTVRF